MSVLIDTFVSTKMILFIVKLDQKSLLGKLPQSLKMKRPTTFQIAGLFMTLFLFACGNEEKFDQNALLGHWELVTATRDGRRAPSVEGAYFNFLEDGALQTNIASSPETATYKVEGMVIQQRESRFEIDYTIEELTDTSLVLTTELRNAQFRFFLKKAAMEE
jgi:hypothetical protein